MLHAEIIAIGDELVSGQRLDTNSQWLSRELGQMGVPTRFHTAVGDEIDATVAALRTAFARVDVVVCTGGLGPTADDLARESLAAALGVALEKDDDVLNHIRAIFARRGRSMPERNKRQAMFPVGSQVIPNPGGTAPGIAAKIERHDRAACHVFTLPGVPSEMRQMWLETVQPAIGDLDPAQQVIRHRVLKCFGLGESHLEQRVGNIIERGRQPSVGITVHEGTITLRITARADSDEACAALIEPVERSIREQLGDVVLGTDDTDVAHAVAELLVADQSTMAVVEFGTEGWLARELAVVSQGGSWYCSGLIRPSIELLTPYVAAGTIINVGCSHGADDIGRVAEAGRAMFAADYALATGPYFAEQSDGDVDQVHVAMAHDSGTISQTIRLAHNRSVRTPIVSKTLLNLLRRRLLGTRR